MPGQGLGYGLLRYLNAETAAELAGPPAPQLGFNYLGRFAGGGAWSADCGRRLERADEAAQRWAGGGDAAMPLAHVIEINALTQDGAAGPRLTANWSWAPALLDEAAVARSGARAGSRALTALARHAAQPGAGGRTPSDLPLVDLTQGEIERLESASRRIEDILPLSPLQEGLLFHALYDAQGPDVYTVQLELELEGVLDARGAAGRDGRRWSARHASLRAGFWQEHLQRPVQVVLARAAVPWRLIDLSDCDGGEQQRRLAEILEADRLERFDLAAPPLMRFALIRLAADRHRLVISNHHLLMDGWSAPILVRELLAGLCGRAAARPRCRG